MTHWIKFRHYMIYWRTSSWIQNIHSLWSWHPAFLKLQLFTVATYGAFPNRLGSISGHLNHFGLLSLRPPRLTKHYFGGTRPQGFGSTPKLLFDINHTVTIQKVATQLLWTIGLNISIYLLLLKFNFRKGSEEEKKKKSRTSLHCRT